MDSQNPIAQYRTPKDGPLKVLCAQFATGSTAANQVVMTAITGMRIRIMGLCYQTSSGANGVIELLNGSGGPVLYGPYLAPPNTTGILEKLPIVDSGYFETSTGVGLYFTGGTAAVNMNVFYVVYTP